MTACQSPFFIWFTGRTGSTLLCDLLDSHPQVHCRKEDFSEIRLDGPAKLAAADNVVEFNGGQFVRRLFTPSGIIDHPSAQETVDYLHQIFASSPDASGFKLKFPGQSAVYPEIMQALERTDNIKVIELSRNNVLKQAISLRNVSRLQKLGACQSGNSRQPVQLEPLTLDVELAVAHAKYFLKTNAEFQHQIRKFLQVEAVTYEQLRQQPLPTLQRILDFLAVDKHIELKSEFQKITPDRISDAVKNYDELVAAVRGTELEVFLD